MNDTGLKGIKPRIKDDLVERKGQLRDRNREYVNSLKERMPCADRGVSYSPWIMQFDHLGEDKVVRSPAGIARLLAEIAKCEIVCANCHADRTHQRLAARG